MRGAFVPTPRLHRLAASNRLATRGLDFTVLLVDDVVSSAATLDHCARALKAGGVTTVIAAAAAT
jgi:predicted amidophosphoribosyltransferase